MAFFIISLFYKHQKRWLFALLLMFSGYVQSQTNCTGFAVVVGNWDNASLHRFDGTTGNYESQLVAGVGQRINSVLQYPSPNGNLYLGGSSEVNVVDAFTGVLQFSFSGGPFAGLTEQIVVGLDGKVYVANEGGPGSIARYNAATGAYIDTFISFPSYTPNGLAQDASGNWYVSTRNSPNEVLMYNSSGVLQGTVTSLGSSQIGGGLKVFNNELYVVNTDNPQTVKVFSLPISGFPATPVRTLATGGSTYVGIGFGPDNNLYMADFYNSRVSVWNPITGDFVRNLTNSSILNFYPHGVGFTACTPVVCIPPTATANATNATCTGSIANSDGKITIGAFTVGQRYQYTSGTTFTGIATPAAITAIPAGGVVASTLPNTTGSYTVRIYDATDDACYVDRVVSITTVTCGSSSSCCTTEILAQSGLESTETMNTKFPNATVTLTNNSASFGYNVTTAGWNFDDGGGSGKSIYRIRDASRASEGSEFIYLPFQSSVNAYNYCIQPIPKITFSAGASCAPMQMVVGRRYVLAFDYVPFNQDVPNGGTGQQKPTSEIYDAGGALAASYTAYSSAGTLIPYEPAVSWANIKTSWKRAYFSIIAPSNSDAFYASSMKDGTSGMLIDNLSLKEITMTTGAISTVTCDATQSKRVFTLNPTSNVGGIPN